MVAVNDAVATKDTSDNQYKSPNVENLSQQTQLTAQSESDKSVWTKTAGETTTNSIATEGKDDLFKDNLLPSDVTSTTSASSGSAAEGDANSLYKEVSSAASVVNDIGKLFSDMSAMSASFGDDPKFSASEMKLASSAMDFVGDMLKDLGSHLDKLKETGGTESGGSDPGSEHGSSGGGSGGHGHCGGGNHNSGGEAPGGNGDMPSSGGTHGGSDTPTSGGTSGGTDTPSSGGTSGGTDTPSSGGSTGGTDTPSSGGTAGGTDTPSSGGTTGGSDTPTSGGTSGGTDTPSSGGTTGGTDTPSSGGTTGGTDTPTTGGTHTGGDTTGVGGTTPRTPGTPFSSDSVFNLPLGSNAQWAENEQLQSAGVYVNTVGNYNENIYTSTASDPLVTVTNDAGAGGTPGTFQVHIPAGAIPAGGDDKTFTVNDTASGKWFSFGGFNWTGENTATVSQGSDEPIDGNGMTQAGSNWDEGVGTLTQKDLEAGAINHMLRMELPTTMLMSYDKNSTDHLVPYAWPQTAEDGFANNGNGGPVYTGTVPYGVTIGIPADAKEPDDVKNNAGAHMLWTALQTHGAMIRDSGGTTNNVIFQTDQYVDPNDPLIAAMNQYGNEIMSSARILTNQGPDSVNGGGTPIVPLIEPI